MAGKQEMHRDEAAAAMPRDPRGLAAWVVESLDGGTIDTRRAQTLLAAARLLATLGPDRETSAEALADLVLRGRISHGLPPRSAGEWERAARLFDDAALDELRRWERLLELDGRHHIEDLFFGERAAHEPDAPVLDDEDGVRADGGQ
jgi:hypothetical protein